MSILGMVNTGPRSTTRITLLYGEDGVGKTTWASCWPDPLIVCTEDGAGDVGAARTPLLTHASHVDSVLDEIVSTRPSYKTIVLDSLDWAERLYSRQAADALGVDSLASAPYGTGYSLMATMFTKMLDKLSSIRGLGYQVVAIAHAAESRYEPPGEESYTRSAPALHRSVCASAREWADEVLFARRSVVVTTEDLGFKRVRNIAVGTGERVLYTEARPGFMAKSRLPGLPSEMSFQAQDYLRFVYPEGVCEAHRGDAAEQGV